MSDNNVIDAEVVEVKEGQGVGIFAEVKDKRGNGRFRSRERQQAKILQLHARGLTVQDISKSVGMSYTGVKEILKRFKPFLDELKGVEDFRDNKSELLAAGQLAALKSAFSGGKLKKASFLSTLRGYEILNKSERLENGESTENHAHLGKFSITHGEK